MSPVERVAHLLIGIFFASLGGSGLVIAGMVVNYGIIYQYWEVVFSCVPLIMVGVIATFVCAWEAIQTFRTGRL